MTLSQKQLKEICLANSGSKCCRYLYADELDPTKHYCCKLRPIEKAKIDEEIEVFLIDCKKRKINPKSLNKSLGNNCEGYLFLKNIKQGYDCG